MQNRASIQNGQGSDWQLKFFKISCSHACPAPALPVFYFWNREEIKGHSSVRTGHKAHERASGTPKPLKDL